MPDVESTVFEIIAKKALIDSSAITRATEFTNMNLNSIDTIEIIFEIEEALGISIPFNANQKLSATKQEGVLTAGEVVDLVAAQVASESASRSAPPAQ